MGQYRSPFNAASRQTCSFKKKGSWAAGYHTGVDRVCDSNTAIVAPADGTVKRNDYSDSYGNFIVLLTNDNKSILMAHLKAKSSLEKGEKVKKGDFVGYMGATGNATGAHLHIEVQNSDEWAYNKNLINPNDYINWNDYSFSGSSKDYVTSVKWKNGSTSETVYEKSNLEESIGTINIKESALCYGKKENGYIVVYNLDSTDKHKAGFVKYCGGVKSVPSGGKTYKNGSTSETVYADTEKRMIVGSLDVNESCTCLAKIDKMYMVLYKVNGTGNYKTGFVVYDGVVV